MKRLKHPLIFIASAVIAGLILGLPFNWISISLIIIGAVIVAVIEE